MSNLIALHGFLGLPSDWSFLPNCRQMSLYDHSFAPPCSGIVAFAQSLNRWAETFECPILMGYSLGGRLALNALLQNTKLWKAAIIVSAHPGFADPASRQNRNKHDQRWADRFLNEKWDSLMNAWESQPVFANGKFSFIREEKNYDRTFLSDTLRYWSLGSQADLTHALTQLQIPILWVAGQNDSNYCEIAKKITLSHPLSSVHIVPNAGHRVPWEQTTLFNSLLSNFIKTHLRQKVQTKE